MLETTYIFRSLPEQDSIRLLRLLPGESTASLQCELFSVRLSSKPVYRAISYVWGSRIPEATIQCGGETIIITKNCGHALRRLRDPIQPTTLWVDSICINQKDPKERGQQVKNMGTIYREASSVLIWLGPWHEGDSKAVKDDISTFSDMIRLPLSQGLTLRQILDRPLQSDVEARLSARDFSAWKRFWKLQYWTRTWVVQEVGLASKAVIVYGPDEIDWEDLMRASAWLSYSGYLPSIPSGSSVRSGWAGYNRHNRTQFSTRGDDLASEITFLDCLDSARRGHEATDSRDMVYAFLAHPDAHEFTPDYFQGPEVVYYNFAVSCLAAHKNPSVLSYATRSLECRSLEDPPTWCPVWNDKGHLPYPLLGLNRSRDYETSRTTLFEYGVTGRKLTVTGIVFETIKFATAPISSRHIHHDNENADSYPNPLLEAFEKSLESASSCTAVYSDLVKSFARTLAARRHIEFDVVAPVGRESSESDANSISQWYRNVEGKTYLASLNRCFFITQQGYMGIGPPNIQEGDICCVVFGAKVPFILRSNDDETCQLVGESYIEGMMDGKVLNMLERGELQEGLIVLV